MPIAVQNDATPNAAQNVTSLGVTLNVASGDGLLAVIFIANKGDETITSVTSSDGADTVISAIDTSGVSPGVAIYFILNPVVNATKILTVNFSASTTIIIGASSFTSVPKINAVEQTATSNDDSSAPLLPFTANTSNGMIVWANFLSKESVVCTITLLKIKNESVV